MIFLKKKDINDDFSPEDMTLKNSVASAWECTGITPTVPGGETEAEAYSDIYDLPVSHKNANEYLKSLPEHIRRRVLESGVSLDDVDEMQTYVSGLKI